VVAVIAAPRVQSVPEYVRSLGCEVIELSASAGLILDDHQSLVITAAMGLRDDDTFAAFEIGVVEPRQNGKGGILEARELAGIVLLGEELLIHSAHEYATSLEAFYRMLPLLETAGIAIRRVRNAHGEQGFDFMNGCRIRYRTRTRGGGRGFSCDCLLLDEAMFLPDFAHSALLPTLSARDNPQVWYMGSSVDQETHENGIVLARVRERGIAGDPSLAYFEWSLPFEHPDEVPDEVATDEAAWAEANPAMGLRIAAEHVAHEQRSMSARNFAVERLGVGDWPSTDLESALIDLDLWRDLIDTNSHALDPVCLAFAVKRDRSRGAIAAAGLRPDGKGHIEIIDHRPGTGWIVDRMAELVERHQPLAVICDGGGPAASLIPGFTDVSVEVTTITGTEFAKACGMFFDVTQDRKLRHLGTTELLQAIKGASQRSLGEAWAWARKASAVDISPLEAVTIALWGTLSTPAKQEFRAVSFG